MNGNYGFIPQDEEIVDVEPVSPLDRREARYGAPDGELNEETGHIEPVDVVPNHKRPLDTAPDSGPVQAVAHYPNPSLVNQNEDERDHSDEDL